jgi:hypothetical protein
MQERRTNAGDSSPLALKRSAVQAHPQGRSPDLQVDAKPATFPFLRGTVARCCTDSLAAYSGATVRDFHPLPFSLARVDENLGAVSIITTPE